MRRDEVIARLKASEPAIRALGAAALYLYGSHARDAASAGSDVDLFIDKEPGRKLGFDDFMDIYLNLRSDAGRRNRLFDSRWARGVPPAENRTRSHPGILMAATAISSRPCCFKLNIGASH